jgi:hypothetical protein
MISLPVMTETVEVTIENYQQVLNESVVEKIDDLKENGYCLDDMIVFIQEFNQNDFINYYDEYVDFGENHSYDAVDAFIEEFSIADISHFEDVYRGQYDSKADYAEQYVSGCYVVDMPSFLEIDWEASFDNLDCVYVDGFVFDTQF